MPTNVEVPALGESVREAILVKWHKADGAAVAVDEPICELETDKANVDIPSPAAGVIRRVKNEGDTVSIGEIVARIDDGPGDGSPASSPAAAKPSAPPAPKADKAPADKAIKPEDLRPSVRRIVEENKLDPGSIKGTGPSGQITREDATTAVGQPEPNQEARGDDSPKASAPPPPASQPAPAAPRPGASNVTFDASGVRRVPMTRIRKKIAERLVDAQQTAAILTTFNEVDLSSVMEIRSKHKERFEKAHGVGLGFMSFFARAVVLAIREYPRINGQIDGDDIIYHDHVHLGIAVSTDRGLAVPVLRNVESMSFARIESEIKRLAGATREGKLSLQELSGGTFTITNGGVFGSLLSTPIINPPQSGILGMHAIQKRAMVIGDKIEIRPMMYIALSYDHRLVDGKDSVSFLVRVKEYLEDPARLMLEI